MDRRSTTSCCVFVWENLVNWKSEKQDVVSGSNAKSQLRAVAHEIYEGLWIMRVMRS